VGKIKDLTGQTFGHLTVVSLLGVTVWGERKRTVWKCRCSCGGIAMVKQSHLIAGQTKSCGCRSRDAMRALSPLLTVDGVTKTVRDWERHRGYRHGVIKDRLAMGWSPERAVYTPWIPRNSVCNAGAG